MATLPCHIAVTMDEQTSPDQVAIAIPSPDWKTIQQRYFGDEGLDDIAKDYGITANSIAARAYREGWRDQQLLIEVQDQVSVSNEIRANILVSVLKESRMFMRMAPSRSAGEADTWSKVRERLVSTAARLLGWDADPLAKTKQVKAIDV